VEALIKFKVPEINEKYFYQWKLLTPHPAFGVTENGLPGPFV
jgi:hypothetical protein